jgi:hypothetical protein
MKSFPTSAEVSVIIRRLPSASQTSGECAMNADRIALIVLSIGIVGAFAVNFDRGQSEPAPATPRSYLGIPAPSEPKGSYEAIWILDQQNGTVRWCHITVGDPKKVECATE